MKVIIRKLFCLLVGSQTLKHILFCFFNRLQLQTRKLRNKPFLDKVKHGVFLDFSTMKFVLLQIPAQCALLSLACPLRFKYLWVYLPGSVSEIRQNYLLWVFFLHWYFSRPFYQLHISFFAGSNICSWLETLNMNSWDISMSSHQGKIRKSVSLHWFGCLLLRTVNVKMFALIPWAMTHLENWVAVCEQQLFHN